MSTSGITSRDYNFLDITRKSGSASGSSSQEKMMASIFEGGFDIKKLLLLSYANNPMMMALLSKMMGEDAASEIDAATLPEGVEEGELRSDIMQGSKDYIGDEGIKDVTLNKNKTSLDKAKLETLNGDNATHELGSASNEATQYTVTINGKEEVFNASDYLALDKENKPTGGLDIKKMEKEKRALEREREKEKLPEGQNFAPDKEAKLQQLNAFVGDKEEKEKSKLTTYVQTGADEMHTATLDENGKVQTIGPKVETLPTGITAKKIGDGTSGTSGTIKDDDLAKKDFTLGTDAEDKALRDCGALTVDKDGNTTLDLTKIPAKDRDALIKRMKTNGINYNGKGKLTVNTVEGQEGLKVNMGKDAKILDIKGKGTIAEVNAGENKVLQINAEEKSTIGKIEGKNLEQLVLKGGNIESDLKNLDKLKALKIEKSTLLTGLNVATKEGDIAVELNNIATKEDINVTSAEDADVKIKNLRTIKAKKDDKDKNINVYAEKNAFFHGTGGSAEDVTVSGKEGSKTTLENMYINDELDVAGTDGFSGVAIVGSTNIKGGIFTNEKNEEDQNEIVYKDARNINNIEVDGTKISENEDIQKPRKMEAKDAYNYLGWTNKHFQDVQKAQQERESAAAYASQYMPQSNTAAILAQGFVTGVKGYNYWNQNGQFNTYS